MIVVKAHPSTAAQRLIAIEFAKQFGYLWGKTPAFAPSPSAWSFSNFPAAQGHSTVSIREGERHPVAASSPSIHLSFLNWLQSCLALGIWRALFASGCVPCQSSADQFAYNDQSHEKTSHMQLCTTPVVFPIFAIEIAFPVGNWEMLDFDKIKTMRSCIEGWHFLIMLKQSVFASGRGTKEQEIQLLER